MDSATKILIVGGVANVVISFMLGSMLAQRRRTGPIDEHRTLLVAHETSLQQGVLLLSLTLALVLSDLSSAWEITAAWLLVGGSLLNLSGNVSNFKAGVRDQFAEKSLGLQLNTLHAPVMTAGIVIVLIGVLSGL